MGLRGGGASKATPLEMWLLEVGWWWWLTTAGATERAGRAAMVTMGEVGIMEFRMSARQSATSLLGAQESAGV